MKQNKLIKVLLVEDDEDKRDDISMYVSKKLNVDLDLASSFHGAKKAILKNTYDFILLDMSIPTFDVTSTEEGGRSQPFGGRTLLYEMKRKKIKTKVIVVTQFSLFGIGDNEISLKELNEELEKSFKELYLGAVSFNIGYEDWKSKLINKIESNV